MRTRVLTGVAGALFGATLWRAAAGLLPEVDPERWDSRDAMVPVETAELAGSLLRSPQRLDLWGRRAVAPRYAFQQGKITIQARVPEGGQLRVRLGTPLPPPMQDQPVQTGGSAPSPTPPAPGGAAPPGDAGAVARAIVGEHNPSILVDRSSRKVIAPTKLACSPVPAPSEHFELQLVVRADTLTVLVDGEERLVCRGYTPRPGVSLTSGVRRVQVSSFRIEGEEGVFEDDFSGAGRSPVVGAVAAGLGAVVGFSASSLLPGAAWLLLPAILSFVLGWVSLRGTLDGLRLLEVPEALAPLIFGGLPAVYLLVLLVSARIGRRGLAALVLGSTLAPAALAAVAGGAASAWAMFGAGLGLWGVLGWVNSHPVRWRPALSWAVVLGVVGLTELGLRRVGGGRTWETTRGWARATEEFRQLIEVQRHPDYPSEGFPVRPPAAQAELKRVVALGGSSTGGAYQMDDLRYFWPHKLGSRLAGQDWEVVNQGVGGWNSLHIRLYVDSQIDRLAGDVYALYVGHNDVMSSSPVPYRTLYERYQRSTAGTRNPLRELLEGYRLYVGLRYVVLGLRDGEGMMAVPVEDARDNLKHVIDLVHARGGRVLLMSEGLNPDPAPMAPYQRMLAGLAETTGARYLDTAAYLYEQGDPDYFLDDCHLTIRGHEVLAARVHAEIQAAGWL